MGKTTTVKQGWNIRENYWYWNRFLTQNLINNENYLSWGDDSDIFWQGQGLDPDTDTVRGILQIVLGKEDFESPQTSVCVDSVLRLNQRKFH